MDELDGIPQDIFGYHIKSRTKIVLTLLVPAIFEFLVYVVVITADICITALHFTNGSDNWAIATLTLIWLPPVICFGTVFCTKSQWPEGVFSCYNRETVEFVIKNISNLILFPLGAIYRFCRLIFWSVESLFHDKSSYEREQVIRKASETSPFELYHFLQAFVQAAPQILLQLYILLREDTFRNYETTTAQVTSIIFSFITLSTIIMSYQRFESQKIIGRQYPWANKDVVYLRRDTLKRMTSTQEEMDCMRRQIQSANQSTNSQMATNIMSNFYNKFGPANEEEEDEEIEIQFDEVPRRPAPPTPPISKLHNLSNRISTFKDMMILDAEKIIKDHVPRLPEGMFKDDQPEDEVDFRMPKRLKIIVGLEQDNVLGKTVLLIGWIMFLYMRLVSLAAFSAFYPAECAYLCLSHYLIMLFAIVYETKFDGEKLTRKIFYIFLAYVYIFALLEFKIKFTHVKRWYLLYFGFILIQTCVITNLWYDLDSEWWYQFMVSTIYGSGALCLACLLFYFFVLKPKDKILYVNETVQQ